MLVNACHSDGLISIDFILGISLCRGMKEQRPHIDSDGKRYLNVRQAAQIVGGICDATMWLWAKAGVTSFGFELDVKRVPMIHHARSFRHDAKTHLETRMVISEADVLALKEIMQAAGKKEPGNPSLAERAELELRANNYRRLGSPFTMHHL
jgi:hypothetical protein